MKRTSTVFEVDQSIKIGDLSADTILAYSNHKCRTVRIPVAVKKELLLTLRERGKSSIRATVNLFTAALFLLLEDVALNSSLIVVDPEYTGYEDDIKGMLLKHFRSRGLHIYADTIVFRSVGKSSWSHILAVEAHRGVRSVDQVLRLEDFKRVLPIK
jgi:hypothetical protein